MVRLLSVAVLIVALTTDEAMRVKKVKVDQGRTTSKNLTVAQSEGIQCIAWEGDDDPCPHQGCCVGNVCLRAKRCAVKLQQLITAVGAWTLPADQVKVDQGRTTRNNLTFAHREGRTYREGRTFASRREETPCSISSTCTMGTLTCCAAGVCETSWSKECKGQCQRLPAKHANAAHDALLQADSLASAARFLAKAYATLPLAASEAQSVAKKMAKAVAAADEAATAAGMAAQSAKTVAEGCPKASDQYDVVTSLATYMSAKRAIAYAHKAKASAIAASDSAIRMEQVWAAEEQLESAQVKNSESNPKRYANEIIKKILSRKREEVNLEGVVVKGGLMA